MGRNSLSKYLAPRAWRGMPSLLKKKLKTNETKWVPCSGHGISHGDHKGAKEIRIPKNLRAETYLPGSKVFFAWFSGFLLPGIFFDRTCQDMKMLVMEPIKSR